MLMIERRPGTSMLIGEDIRIHVREIKRRNSVRIGIDAPCEIPVMRNEPARERGLVGVDGIDVLQAVRGHASASTLPIVVLGSSAEDENVTRCVQSGASAFIAKSTAYREFGSRIARITEFWSHARSVA